MTTTVRGTMTGGMFAASVVGILARLRELHPDMTLLQAQMLFSIAQTPGTTQRALYAALDTNDATAARTMAILSDIGGRFVEPLNLIEMRVNPLDRRERLLYLTKKGERLLADCARDLNISLGG